MFICLRVSPLSYLFVCPTRPKKLSDYIVREKVKIFTLQQHPQTHHGKGIVSHPPEKKLWPKIQRIRPGMEFSSPVVVNGPDGARVAFGAD